MVHMNATVSFVPLMVALVLLYEGCEYYNIYQTLSTQHLKYVMASYSRECANALRDSGSGMVIEIRTVRIGDVETS